MKPIYLASKSPRRKTILEDLLNPFFITFSCIDSDFSEITQGLSPKDIVMENAKGKAEATVKKAEDDSVILGADTAVFLKDEYLGKPKNEEQAKAFLRKLSGQTHFVYTGVALSDCLTDRLLVDYEKTVVTFASIPDHDIDMYIKTKEPMGKAGAYGIQGLGEVFVEKIEGSYSNVVGLPKRLVWSFFKEMGILK